MFKNVIINVGLTTKTANKSKNLSITTMYTKLIIYLLSIIDKFFIR